MSTPDKTFMPPPPVVAIAGWLVPGLGYCMLGQRLRGTVIGVTIVLLFVAGLVIGGLHVIDAPTGLTIPLIFQKPWFICQIMTGPICAASSFLANHWGTYIDPASGKQMIGVAFSHARVNEIGVLYTAIAGMLNLMAVIDSSYRSSNGGYR